MTNNSAVKSENIENLSIGGVVSPRKSTISIIRQFSRSYVAMAGISISPLICN